MTVYTTKRNLPVDYFYVLFAYEPQNFTINSQFILFVPIIPIFISLWGHLFTESNGGGLASSFYPVKYI